MLADRRREGNSEVGVNVDLADGKSSRLLELAFGNADRVGHGTAVLVDDRDLILRHAGCAVQDDGEAGQTSADLFENVDAQLGILTGLELVCAVAGADGDRKRVDARAGGEFLDLVGRGEHRVVIGDVHVVLNARELSQLRLYDDAVRMRVFDDLLGDGDILLPGLAGSVDHDGGEAAVDGRLADFKVSAVVQMHRDRDIRRLDRSLHEVTQVHGVRVLSRARRNLKDDGGTALVCRFHDRLDHFHIVDVECADRIAACIRLFEHFSRSDQRHG